MKLEKRLSRLLGTLKTGERSQSTIALMAYASTELQKISDVKKKKGIK